MENDKLGCFLGHSVDHPRSLTILYDAF